MISLTGKWGICVLALSCALSAIAQDKQDSGGVIRFDFETGDLQGWQVVEGKFDRLVSDRPTFHNQYTPDNKYNKQGKYYLSTVEQEPGMEYPEIQNLALF